MMHTFGTYSANFGLCLQNVRAKWARRPTSAKCVRDSDHTGSHWPKFRRKWSKSEPAQQNPANCIGPIGPNAATIGKHGAKFVATRRGAVSTLSSQSCGNVDRLWGGFDQFRLDSAKSALGSTEVRSGGRPNHRPEMGARGSTLNQSVKLRSLPCCLRCRDLSLPDLRDCPRLQHFWDGTTPKHPPSPDTLRAPETLPPPSFAMPAAL